MLEIYALARDFMAAHGNPHQWGTNNWPPVPLLEADIKGGNSYVCVTTGGRVVGTFCYLFGPDIEPTYRVIEGSWRSDTPYGVVHRLAGDGSERGVGAFCLEWALSQCGHLRIDTHGDNKVMQRLLEKQGFDYRGIIHVVEDPYPRLAYDLLSSDRDS